ncbi:hypothetical protein JZ751_022150 [Albula glossodonta]|uniref:Uncharacterized protein n=1 Tax=Albula glossodonta TaxID=121402 RepID=A0A8T2NIF2_9TELE|nr:hypothetical protein JZ751_022150 [Albula glossodonta]
MNDLGEKYQGKVWPPCDLPNTLESAHSPRIPAQHPGQWRPSASRTLESTHMLIANLNGMKNSISSLAAATLGKSPEITNQP